MTLQLVAPELDHTAQVELADDVMRLNQGVHVGLESMICIDALLIKLDLDEAVRVCSDDEVDLGPVNHNHLLDVVNNVWQLARNEALKTAILLCRSEIAIEDLLLVEPLGAQKFFFAGLIRIIVHEIWHHVVFLFFLSQEAVMVLPVVLVHTRIESLTLGNHILFALTLLPLVLLMLEIHGVLVREPLVVAEQAAAGERGDLRRGLSPHQIAVLLVVHDFSNGVWKQVRRQVSQRGVVTHSEAPRDCILLLVREVIEELCQIGQLVVVDGVVHRDRLTTLVAT